MTPYRRTSSRKPEALNRAGTFVEPPQTAGLQPATTALEWNSGIET
ncbi:MULTISPECIES: hypothetical protein [unclassified Nocardioides]|nr:MULTISPECIES: hypothetical protein [unclassified Nocardioides]